jgi:hypothetical protein
LASCLPTTPASPTATAPKRIFQSEVFYSKYECLAHKNLLWEIEELRGSIVTDIAPPARSWLHRVWPLCLPIVVPLALLVCLRSLRK